MTTADFILRGGQVIHVQSRSIECVDVCIKDGKFIEGAADANEVIELHGSFVAPGFIDAHMHVESTMLPPTSFATLAVAS